LRDKLNLPHVGQQVRHKIRRTLWKVIEEKELWVKTSPSNGEPPQEIPAIYLRFWKIQDGNGQGRGKTRSHQYTPADNSFSQYWEILEK
jgi:hypothetical protein